MGTLRDNLAEAARFFTSVHSPNGRPNACIVSAPRSGSTWLLELILTQPGFKPCNEPFNLRKQAVVQRLGLDRWEQLNDPASLPRMKAYLQTFLENRYSAAFKGLRPGLPYHRFLTHRIAFKILFACEHRIDWLQEILNARVVVLIRHPIPVALSRTELPRLNAFLRSDFRDYLSSHQLRVADDVLARGDPLESAVLDWCLQYAVTLTHFADRFLLLTYEQLVVEPQPVLDALAAHLELDWPERMRARIGQPSASISKSKPETVEFLGSREREGDSKRWLVEKWRSKIAAERAQTLVRITEELGIDVYSNDPLPREKYWI